MNDGLKQAIGVLGKASPIRFDVWNMAGRHNAPIRAQLMALLLGVPKVPQAKAGVNALEAEFCKQAGIESWTCGADRENKLAEFCRVASGLPADYYDAYEAVNGVRLLSRRELATT